MAYRSMKITQNIDRLYRLVNFSRRRVLIIFVALTGSFLLINYAVFSENYGISNKFILSKSFSINSQTSNNSTFYFIKTQKPLLLPLLQSSPSTISNFYYSSLPNISSTSQSSTILLNETEVTEEDTDYFLQEDFLNDDLEINSTASINNLFIFTCKNVTVRRVLKRKKNLIVYENFIMRDQRVVKCYESIEYTTHGDYRYLDNLIPLAERWNGPISVAVYCPGEDLQPTLRIISYLRICMTNKISELVSFHLIFEAKYNRNYGKREMQFRWIDDLYEKEKWTDCSIQPNLKKDQPTFRVRKRLLYPVNIARNVARAAAATHFLLASDIELYPSVNLIPAFFRMLKEQTNDFLSPEFPRVFVLPIFEVKKGLKPPKHKSELLAFLKNKRAFPFHTFVCSECHRIPRFEDWIAPSNYSGLHVFHVAKRKPPFQFWEPIYIGTKYEPPYDERLSYEGLRDKMTQGYILCALNYDFMVLDNAFLVHRPGIKRLSHKITKTVLRQDRLINLKIKSELFRTFKKQDGCVL